MNTAILRVFIALSLIVSEWKPLHIEEVGDTTDEYIACGRSRRDSRADFFFT